MGLWVQTKSNTFHFFPNRWFVASFLHVLIHVHFPFTFVQCLSTSLFFLRYKADIFNLDTEQAQLSSLIFLAFLPQKASPFYVDNLVLQVDCTTSLWSSYVMPFIPVSSYFPCVCRAISKASALAHYFPPDPLTGMKDLSCDGTRGAACNCPLQPSPSLLA